MANEKLFDYMNNNERNWTVLFIGGASGTGKSTLAYKLAKFYGINVLEVDDIGQALKASTTKDILPIIHYWSTGINWMDIDVEGNLNWLINNLALKSNLRFGEVCCSPEVVALRGLIPLRTP